MLIGTLPASLIGRVLGSKTEIFAKGVIATGEGVIWAGKGIIKEDQYF